SVLEPPKPRYAIALARTHAPPKDPQRLALESPSPPRSWLRDARLPPLRAAAPLLRLRAPIPRRGSRSSFRLARPARATARPILPPAGKDRGAIPPRSPDAAFAPYALPCHGLKSVASA